MYLAGVVSGIGVHILVDTGATHNIININVARLIGLQEQRINTAILVRSWNEVPCRAAAFNVPLRIDADVFDIDAYPLDIGNDVDIILSTPWLASLGRLTWDFTTMQLQYVRNGRLFTFTTVQRRHTPATVLALLAPPPIERATRATTLPPPGNMLSRAC